MSDCATAGKKSGTSFFSLKISQRQMFLVKAALLDVRGTFSPIR